LFIFGEIKNIEDGALLKLASGAILIFGAMIISRTPTTAK
jgi:hypothetical protein